ncbi:CMP-sialic acid transporter [Hondaea fermentalgiana]|uniref:CMP-sialic acid transporter n=1 Tax=Hondaea fermentalgiana TaxID=2315210 RepID=A0A2R5GS72_9STRA|nr:CMP-sialic acid transporter [Hondaea fermentalgiana]|eukprot:GBG30724.1 CMP-sialic acid transporter [Hondaea fermentalgiana]
MNTERAVVELPGGLELQLKYVSLVLLIVQNVALVLMIKVSKLHHAPDKPSYVSSTAILCAEFMKLGVSLSLEYQRFTRDNKVATPFRRHLIRQLAKPDTMKLSVPGILYTVQSNLLFMALNLLSVGVYQVSMQLKILLTAAMSYFVLGKTLSPLQVISLVILMCGVAAVQLSQVVGDDKLSDARQQGQYQQLLGFGATVLACIISAFAGVYLEKVLKSGSFVSIWMRNVQLSLFGILIGLFTVVGKDGHRIGEFGFFGGYNWTTWIAICLQAWGGLIVAVVIKYADNILKGFATAVSILFISFVSVLAFDTKPSLLMAAGTGAVFISVLLYISNPVSAGFSRSGFKVIEPGDIDSRRAFSQNEFLGKR